ncbi:MAG: adenylate/guanylate cyclase domain-containing protein [Motiliproteus sp.]
MAFNDGNVNAFLVGTDRKQGFSDGDVAKFKLLVAFFAPVLEAIALRLLARSLLDTYIGPRSGKKVLKGHIQRGDNEQIDAVIWFSDLRDFTVLSSQLSNDELLRLLNCYFETVAAAVTRNGGEVLRFIGDAMLVLFPCAAHPTPEAACHQAVKAAEKALAAVQSLNRERQVLKQPLLNFGIGLDQGKVIYGNVGAPNRLDFTVIGVAVNRAARLEALTKTLEVPLLMSEEVARWMDPIVKPIGHIPLKGMPVPQPVYSLAGMPSARS